MPFDATDPRAALTQTAAPPPREIAETQVIPFTDDTAQISQLGTREWLVRTQHAIVSFTHAVAGESWPGPEDRETLIAVPDGPAELRVSAGAERAEASGGSVVVVPEAPSTIEILRDGLVIRVFPAAGSKLLSRCLNASAYARDAANVADYEPVHAEQQLRVHRLSDHPPTDGRFGHIFRSTNLMINFIADRIGPRDPQHLSPHSHTDFEQCSLQLAGEFVHHARSPWTPDLTMWRPDRHLKLVGAGAVIFPPPLEHTSQAVGPGANRLIDVFAPPRSDFLAMDGWVLNAADY